MNPWRVMRVTHQAPALGRPVSECWWWGKHLKHGQIRLHCRLGLSNKPLHSVQWSHHFVPGKSFQNLSELILLLSYKMQRKLCRVVDEAKFTEEKLLLVGVQVTRTWASILLQTVFQVETLVRQVIWGKFSISRFHCLPSVKQIHGGVLESV